jgi:hypothetical protein
MVTAGHYTSVVAADFIGLALEGEGGSAEIEELDLG